MELHYINSSLCDVEFFVPKHPHVSRYNFYWRTSEVIEKVSSNTSVIPAWCISFQYFFITHIPAEKEKVRNRSPPNVLIGFLATLKNDKNLPRKWQSPSEKKKTISSVWSEASALSFINIFWNYIFVFCLVVECVSVRMQSRCLHTFTVRSRRFSWIEINLKKKLRLKLHTTDQQFIIRKMFSEKFVVSRQPTIFVYIYIKLFCRAFTHYFHNYFFVLSLWTRTLSYPSIFLLECCLTTLHIQGWCF